MILGWLYRHEGMVVDELQRKFVEVNGEEVEVNLNGEGSRDSEKIVVIGETKAVIYRSEVEGFVKNAEKLITGRCTCSCSDTLYIQQQRLRSRRRA